MSERLVALFNLKPGVSVAEYEDWAKAVDLPTVNALPSIAAFNVFRVSGLLGSDASAPYGYVEIIDVADMELFAQDVATPTMKAVAGRFGELADVTFLTTRNIIDT